MISPVLGSGSESGRAAAARGRSGERGASVRRAESGSAGRAAAARGRSEERGASVRRAESGSAGPAGSESGRAAAEAAGSVSGAGVTPGAGPPPAVTQTESGGGAVGLGRVVSTVQEAPLPASPPPADVAVGVHADGDAESSEEIQVPAPRVVSTEQKKSPAPPGAASPEEDPLVGAPDAADGTEVTDVPLQQILDEQKSNSTTLAEELPANSSKKTSRLPSIQLPKLSRSPTATEQATKQAKEYFKTNVSISGQDKKKYYATEVEDRLILFSIKEGEVTDENPEKFIEEVKINIIAEDQDQLIANQLAEKVSFSDESIRKEVVDKIKEEAGISKLTHKLEVSRSFEEAVLIIDQFKGSILQNRDLAETVINNLKTKNYISIDEMNVVRTEPTNKEYLSKNPGHIKLILEVNKKSSGNLPDLGILQDLEKSVDPVVLIKKYFNKLTQGETVEINVKTGVSQYAYSKAYFGKFWNMFRAIGNLFISFKNLWFPSATYTEKYVQCDKNKYVENLTTLIEQVDRLMNEDQRKNYLDQIIVPLVREYAKDLNTVGVDQKTHEKLYTAIIKIDPENKLGLINNESRFTYYEDTPTLSATRSKSQYFGWLSKNDTTPEAKNICLQESTVNNLKKVLFQATQPPTPS